MKTKWKWLISLSLLVLISLRTIRLLVCDLLFNTISALYHRKLLTSGSVGDKLLTSGSLSSSVSTDCNGDFLSLQVQRGDITLHCRSSRQHTDVRLSTMKVFSMSFKRRRRSKLHYITTVLYTQTQETRSLIGLILTKKGVMANFYFWLLNQFLSDFFAKIRE